MVLLPAKGKQSRQVANSEWVALKNRIVTSLSEIHWEKIRLFLEGRSGLLKEFPNATNYLNNPGDGAGH